jgi:hypothetical protein
MQRQPDSLFPVADAYRQELLADAARTRPKMDAAGNHRAPAHRFAPRRLLGLALIGHGTRLIGAGAPRMETPRLTSPA